MTVNEIEMEIKKIYTVALVVVIINYTKLFEISQVHVE